MLPSLITLTLEFDKISPSIIYTGKVGTLFREKNQVKQVNNGQECGITVKDYMDFQKNDIIEAFNITSTERSI